MTTYPDHGSPVRRARERAARTLPCEVCGSTGDPVTRAARPLSLAWSLNPGAYLACAGCGRRLVDLTGAAALRASEFRRDRLPDPGGLVTEFLSPLPAHREAALVRLPMKMLGIEIRTGATLVSPDGSRESPDLAFFSMGAPWLAVNLLFCEGGCVPPGRSVTAAEHRLGNLEAVPTIEEMFVAIISRDRFGTSALDLRRVRR